jgi:hypothetical protein
VFGLYRLDQQRFPTLGVYLKFSLYRILVYSEFGLDRFIEEAKQRSKNVATTMGMYFYTCFFSAFLTYTGKQFL